MPARLLRYIGVITHLANHIGGQVGLVIQGDHVVACRGAHSALACGCCWRVAVSDVVFMFSVELNFRLLGVFLCGWQPADSQATRPAEESVVIPSVVVFTSEVLT